MGKLPMSLEFYFCVPNLGRPRKSDATQNVVVSTSKPFAMIFPTYQYQQGRGLSLEAKSTQTATGLRAVSGTTMPTPSHVIGHPKLPHSHKMTSRWQLQFLSGLVV
ncbi:Ff.00g065710.m01.CDS01 [Fusarium sp. VM40]|nr:Ff.00g065710.m01.CDS01 [Fusarium sp. VM40]